MVHLPARMVASIAAALVLVFAAMTGTGTARAETVTIRITQTLEPASVTVAPGTSVRFENADGDRHRMRTTSAPAEFDSGNLESGDSYTVVLSATGTYRYLDERDDENPSYVGQIVVSTSAPATVPGQPPTTSPPAPTAVSVSIGDRIFTPAIVTVAPGGTVTWTNNDDRPHTVTADDRSFDSGIMNTGDTWSLMFPNGGTFSYFCELHPDMRGSVMVDAGGGTVPTNPPSTNPPTTSPPPTGPPPTNPTPTDPPPPTTIVPGSPAPSTATVAIVGNQFVPQTITIVTGGTVTWVNQDPVPHTVTASDRSFDSSILRQGETWSRTFSNAGSYAYFCELHPEMTATVVVVPPGSPAPPPTTPTTTPGVTPTTSPTSPNGSANLPTTSAPANSSTTPNASGSTASPIHASVSIAGNRYVPQIVTISAGGTVTWANDDQVPHTVTAANRSFDSGIMFNGDSWTRTFPTAGTYSYFCELHPEMTATVIVTAAGAPSGAVGVTGPSVTTGGSTSGSPALSGTSGTQGGASSSSSGTSAATGSASTAPGTVAVTMGDNQFEPPSAIVGAGGTVTWTNTDGIPHTVTATDGSFDSGIMMPGDTFSYRFDQLGTVPYRCILHPGMEGTVDVVEGSSTTAGASGSVVASASSEPGGAPVESLDATSGGSGGDGNDDELVVRITDSEFPAVVTVATGQTVTWVNDDERSIDIVADDGSFASGEIASGDEYSHTFSTEGATSYRSETRDRMEGMIVVVPGTPADVEIVPTVAIYDAWFAPRDLVVHQGATVRWAFGGVLPHTVTAEDATFDSGILEPGAVFTVTFDELGTFPYSCLVHPAMVGTVTVVPAGEEIPASRSGISSFDSGVDDAAAEFGAQVVTGRSEPSDGAGAVMLLGLGLMIGLAVGVLYGVGKVAVRRQVVAVN